MTNPTQHCQRPWWKRPPVWFLAVILLGALAYVVAILLMCATAAAYGAASGRWQVLLGAVVFAASDISVARERFVAKSFRNKAWGLPAYFVAQLILAWSVASAA